MPEGKEIDREQVMRLLASFPEAALVVERGGRIRYLNAKFTELTGFGAQELIGEPFHSLLIRSSLSTPLHPPSVPSHTHRFEARIRCGWGSGMIGEITAELFYDIEPGPGYLIAVRDVTADYRQDSSSSEALEAYRLIVEHQTDLIVKTDARLSLQFISPSYCETFGISARNWLGRSFLELSHQDETERLREALEAVFVPPYAHNYQQLSRTLFGKRWFSWHIRAVLNEGHQIASLIAVGRDITDLKEAEIALRRSEERYHRLFEEGIDGIALIDPASGKLIDCNKALCRLVERSKEELVGAGQSILYPSGAAEAKTGAEPESERNSRIITGSGEIREVRMKTSMLRTEEGRFLQIIIHDITEYQRAIEEIERLAKFPEENPNPILRVDPEGVILYANAASAVLLHAWGSNTNERLPEEYRRAAAGAYADMETKELEVAVEEQVFLTLFVPVKEFAYINLYGHDITERKRKEEQLNQLATTDSLTGLLNRRHFIALAEQELERSRRFETRFSILMFDIDHFKQVNDTYGHSMGDTVLTSLGTQTRRLFRGIDLMARVGGEEFMVLMPETELEEALRAAERFRRAIADLELEMEGKTLSITVSIGLAALVEPGQALKQIMHHADIALYEAKRAGRNRIRSYIPQ